MPLILVMISCYCGIYMMNMTVANCCKKCFWNTKYMTSEQIAVLLLLKRPRLLITCWQSQIPNFWQAHWREVRLETLGRPLIPSYWCAGPPGCWGNPRMAQPDPDPGRSSPGSWPRPAGSPPWWPPPAGWGHHRPPPPVERAAHIMTAKLTGLI